MDQAQSSNLGNVDGVAFGMISGWVATCDDGVPVDISILHNGDVIAVVQPSIPRPDVMEAGLGAMNSGFAWKIPIDMYDGLERELTFEAPSHNGIFKQVKVFRFDQPLVSEIHLRNGRISGRLLAEVDTGVQTSIALCRPEKPQGEWPSVAVSDWEISAEGILADFDVDAADLCIEIDDLKGDLVLLPFGTKIASVASLINAGVSASFERVSEYELLVRISSELTTSWQSGSILINGVFAGKINLSCDDFSSMGVAKVWLDEPTSLESGDLVFVLDGQSSSVPVVEVYKHYDDPKILTANPYLAASERNTLNPWKIVGKPTLASLEENCNFFRLKKLGKSQIAVSQFFDIQQPLPKLVDVAVSLRSNRRTKVSICIEQDGGADNLKVAQREITVHDFFSYRIVRLDLSDFDGLRERFNLTLCCESRDILWLDIELFCCGEAGFTSPSSNFVRPEFFSASAAPTSDPNWDYLFLSDSFFRDQLSQTQIIRYDRDPVAFLQENPDFSPHPIFDVAWYRERYNIAENLSPALHYLRSGAAEGNWPNSVFDPDWYRQNLTDQENEQISDPLKHYIEFGKAKNYSTHRFFNAATYLDMNADVRVRGVDAYAHYLSHGHREGRKTSPLLEARYVAEKGQLPLDKNFLNRVVEEYSNTPHELSPLLFTDMTVSKRDSGYKIPPRISSAQSWSELNRPSLVRRIFEQRSPVSLASGRPRFSIVIPVFDPPVDILRQCFFSALDQTFRDFEIVLVNDGSTNSAIASELESYAKIDPRVIVRNRRENKHISATTNEAVDLSNGEYIAFLDNDDMLVEDALAVVDKTIRENGSPDLIYSDDARFNEQGSVLESLRFKVGWSPELLLSYSYISHFRIIKRETYDQIGGTRIGMEGSQDHDMFLRVAEVSDHVVHIPRILYHRRALAGSTASGGDQKPYSLEAGKNAVKEAFSRRGLDVEVVRPDWAIKQNAGIFCPVMPDTGPSVTIIIPTKNNFLKISRLIRSLPQTTYKNYDVLIIDNESDDQRVLSFFNSLPYKVVKIASGPDGFNYSALNNKAVETVNSDYLLFLNDDTEIIDPHWLSQMVGWGRLTGVGAVGARLLLGSGRIQHGGISPTLAVGYTMFRGLPDAEAGYLSYAKVTRNVAAVTAACLLTPTQLFKSLGGFDEKQFGVAYNDVDYCLRVRESGFRIVYCGETALYHHEGSSRPKQDKPREIAAFRAKYKDYEDPYFNPNWSRWHASVQVQPSVPALPDYGDALKVLLVSHNLNLEGAPQSLFELAAGLRSMGLKDITVASPQSGELGQRYAAENIDLLISAPLAAACRAKSATDYTIAISNLTTEFRSGNYDVIIANTAEMHMAIHAAAGARIPSIWIIREGNSWNSYYQNKTSEIENIALSAFSLPYRVVFVSAASQLRWSDINIKDNFTLIRNGLDAERFRQKVTMNNRVSLRRDLGVDDGDCVVVCIGTMCARKGQHDLLLAFLNLPDDQQKRTRLLFVGERRGAYCEAFKAFVATLPVGIQERISIVAETSNVGMYYSVADVFFCGSRVESYPRVILEAEAVGLPIITTPISGIPEQVMENINALFYWPGNVSELVERLSQMLDPKLRQTMAEESAEVFKTLTDYDEMVSSYQRILMQAAAASPGSIVL